MQAANKQQAQHKVVKNDLVESGLSGKRGIHSVDGSSPYSTPFFRPATTLNPNNAWLRRMTRLVRHLRDDLARTYPQEVMPTTWMIRCLLASLAREFSQTVNIEHLSFTDEQWDSALTAIMQKLRDYSVSPEHIRKSFFELDGFTPLFPNQELFGPRQTQRFAELALTYMANNFATEE